MGLPPPREILDPPLLYTCALFVIVIVVNGRKNNKKEKTSETQKDKYFELSIVIFSTKMDVI